MKKYILALDQGTTSSRAILFDRNRHPVASAQCEFRQFYPHEGWVEHDAMEIYTSQHAMMCETVAKSGIDPREIAAIGIANQRETAVVWDRHTGLPVSNAIVWQCRRTAGMIEALDPALAEYIRSATGLVPDAYFSGSKVKWILDHVPGARARAEAGDLLFGTVDSWLLWKLTGGRVHATDYTNASRTMLYNIRTLCWDERLLQAFDIPRSLLPEVADSSRVYGETEVGGVLIPIAGMAGDQQAALFGHGCTEKGRAKNTYGTGCFLLAHTGDEIVRSQNGLLATIASGIGGRVSYALEGSVFVGGAVVQWLRDEMGFFTESREIEALAQSVPDSGGVFFVPAFAGIGAPYWDMRARGTMLGLTRGTTRAHIIRAAEESIAYQSADLIAAVEADMGAPLSELRVDGGASRDAFLMQFQADLLGRPLLRPAHAEMTAAGAAALAGLAVGFWAPEETAAPEPGGIRFEPRLPESERGRLLARWHRAVQRSFDWAED